MKRKPAIKFVYLVQVCDYESCWVIAAFDSEEKAKYHAKNYKLHGHEQETNTLKLRVF